jgi:hypothetical protein
MSLQLANLICMYAVQNASSTSALTVTSTSMRACTIALVARVSAVCLDRDANCVHYAGVDLFFLVRELLILVKLSCTAALMATMLDNQTVCR